MSNYWQDRQKELYSALEKDENDLKIRLASVYEDEYSRLDKEIAAYYQKYGENNVIKYRNLMQTLPKEDVKLLIEQMDDFAAKYPQYAHLLPVRTSIYKLDRLEGLQYSVRMHQLNISAVNQQAISEHLNKQALRGANAAMETMGFGKNFYTVNSDIVKKFVDVPWCNGLSFSQRIWQDGDKLANYITTDIAQGFARGTSYQKLTKQLRTRFEGVAKKDAYRLIYTEGTYVMAESSIQPFTEDFDEYRISTAADGKVCDICASVARQTFKIKDRKPGINFPPFHPWCRCTFEIVEPADWDKWMDDYVKRHKSSGEYLKSMFQNDTIGNSKTHISKDVLKNIKSFDLPELSAKENEELRKAMTSLLGRVEGTAQGTECAYYYDMHMRFIRWVMGQPGKGSVKLYNQPFDYIVLHNHPDGGTFSIGDIKRFAQNDNLKIMIAVGHNGDQYLIYKNDHFDGNKLLSDYYNYSLSLLKQNISLDDALIQCENYLENGANRYGYKFKKNIV